MFRYAPSHATLKSWASEFMLVRETLEDDPRPGRSVKSATPETIHTMHDIVRTDRRLIEAFPIINDESISLLESKGSDI